MEPIPVIPFRWSIEKRQELGSLIDFIKVDLPPGFHEELVASSARILAFAGEAQLYFVGRSPENYFDFLSGAFEEVVELKDRINLFQFSGSRYTYELLAREHQFELEHLRAYMRTIGLSPTQIIGRKIGTTLVDVVYGGGTFRMLVELIHDWARDEKVSWPAVCDKLRIVGITERTKNSPNTWRWQQQTMVLE